MDYVVFGKGRECLVMIPGLGDGLVTVKGMARVLAVTYRMYAKNYTVYMFSRKNGLEKGYSTKDMARDQAEAMEALGILRAKVLGVSQGGMIAQYLAAERIRSPGGMHLSAWQRRFREVSFISMKSSGTVRMKRRRIFIGG